MCACRSAKTGLFLPRVSLSLKLSLLPQSIGKALASLRLIRLTDS